MEKRQIQFFIDADMESLLEKIDACHNNPKKPSTTKLNKYAASGYSLFTQCSFNAAKSSMIITDARIV